MGFVSNKPLNVLKRLGHQRLIFKDEIVCHMKGSHEQRRAYVYRLKPIGKEAQAKVSHLKPDKIFQNFFKMVSNPRDIIERNQNLEIPLDLIKLEERLARLQQHNKDKDGGHLEK